MHTLKIIAVGFLLLALCLLAGRWLGGSPAGMTRGAWVFLPLWFIGAGINMWIGVSRAGYSVADEAPVFLIVFAVPAAAALLLLWWLSRG